MTDVAPPVQYETKDPSQTEEATLNISTNVNTDVSLTEINLDDKPSVNGVQDLPSPSSDSG